MFNNQIITLLQAANGRLVTIPCQHQRFQPMMYDEMYATDDTDHELEKLRSPERYQPKPPIPLKEMKLNNVYLFKTFPEVVKFLEEQLEK